MTHLPAAALSSLLILMTACHTGPVAEKPKPHPTLTGVEYRLSQSRMAVRWAAAPLEEVLREVRDTAGVAMWVDWSQLTDMGIDRSLPISLELQDASTEQVLRLVLQQSMQGSYNTAIAYALHDEVVVITPMADLDDDRAATIARAAQQPDHILLPKGIGSLDAYRTSFATASSE